MAQILSNDAGFIRVIPMHWTSKAPSALTDFTQDFCIPNQIHLDNAIGFESVRWKQPLSDFQLMCTTIEPHCPWQNRAAGAMFDD